ncbi:g7592 [Coccomyxa elongata]
MPTAALGSVGTRRYSSKYGRCHLARAAQEAEKGPVLETAVAAAWDPEGLLPPLQSTTGGHFERRAAERAARLAAADAQTAQLGILGNADATAAAPQLQPTIMPEQGFTPVSSVTDSALRSECEVHLKRVMPMNLDYPGLNILHVDPPIFSIDDFLTREECEGIIQAAGGRLEASYIGPGNASEAAAGRAVVSRRRTSQNMMMDDFMTTRNPRTARIVKSLHTKSLNLFASGAGETWGMAGRLPKPGQFCFESLQVARYQDGQYFMAHEDAFPLHVVPENRFQRTATLLLYLNDVAEGGATHFELLNISVKPKCGKALLFFPAFMDGNPDPRTLHTATNALDTKWIAQQWVACGQAVAAAAPVAKKTFSLDVASKESQDAARRGKGKKADKGGKKAVKKGFGAV